MARIKRICWTDADVKCPFYITDDKKQRSISCEGFAEGTDAVLKFRSLARREKHMGICCVENYESCPMYRCTYTCKYGDGR